MARDTFISATGADPFGSSLCLLDGELAKLQRPVATGAVAPAEQSVWRFDYAPARITVRLPYAEDVVGYSTRRSIHNLFAV